MEQEKRQIPIKVRNKRAELVNPNEEPLVCGNNDYEIVFDFDEDWENYPVKTAMFVYGKDSVPVVFKGNVCDGVEIKDSTMVAIGVFAGDIRTSTGAFLCCVQSIRDIGKTPTAPTPDVYNQIMELLQQAIQAHTELPVGGKTGQVLKKKSDKDYDTEWSDEKTEDLTDYQKKEDTTLSTKSKKIVGAINELNNEKLDKKEAIIIIDVTEESTQESVQELLDLAYGEVVLNIIREYSHLTLTVHNGIKHLVVQANSNDISLTLTGAGKYAGTSVTAYSLFELYISHFTTVYNLRGIYVNIYDCHEVYNSMAQVISRCDEVYDIELSEDGIDSRIYSINDCSVVKNIYICNSSGNDNTNFVNCGTIQGVSVEDSIYSDPYNTVTFSNCDQVSDVYFDTEPYFTNINYINCRYVNPYTCAQYSGKVDFVGRAEFEELKTSIDGVDEILESVAEGGAF